MPAKKKTDTPAEELSFEETLVKIESIVEAMEGEQLPLEDLVAQYEVACTLLARCDSVLSGARKRIELITLANRDGIAGSPSGSDTRPNRPAPENDSDDTNDISLF